MPFPYLTRGSSIRTRARTQSKRNSHTAEARRAQRLLAVADRPSSSSNSTQQQRRCGSGGGQLHAREPPIVRLMTPCLGGCALFVSVTCALVLFFGCVVSRVLCVDCWLFLVMIRTYSGVCDQCMYLWIYVLLRGFFATRKHARRQKLSQIKN